MIFIETPVFTKRIKEILSDDEYHALQVFLAATPDAGDVIPGSRGLRKLRWQASGRGKRGGMRLIYYWYVPDELFMLYPFEKAETEDLTRDQIKKLSAMVEEWL
ncbi:MAG TPA: hypothetical protein DCZ95_19715 [Verrucomicrobia bacterium]|nr:MAG: hypothetical protein A2X46_10940 [Lentisphaerae bacterium GWF2_57_35]HBA86314.1 hypothetical protein [Verrucomicrobiota bacterium]